MQAGRDRGNCWDGMLDPATTISVLNSVTW
jgi:hypothetical protein